MVLNILGNSGLFLGLEKLLIDWIFLKSLFRFITISLCSQMQKCILDEDSVVSLDYIQVEECLNYVLRPVAILESKGFV